MTTLPLHIENRDERHEAIYSILNITGPGAVAIRDPDGRIMVWESEVDSEDDDGARAVFRSTKTLTDEEWDEVVSLAWVEDLVA